MHLDTKSEYVFLSTSDEENVNAMQNAMRGLDKAKQGKTNAMHCRVM